ncbi:MAG: TetR/AcrR family transcriptional regulator [Actinomycetaceae bacterium]|nr:TetR/AcrR family transcriptional regulator [Actinomycetaceae bacterium]
MRRTAEDAERTRLALLKAALMAFDEKGWRGATFEHVARRAGVTRGAVHHHFRSKVALLEQALAWGWEEYGARIFATDGGEDGADGTLSSLLTNFVTLLREEERFRALAACTVLVAPRALDDTSEKNATIDAWRAQIAAGIEGTAGASADAVAGLVLVLFQGLTVTAATRPDDLPQPSELGATIAALARGVATRIESYSS